MTNKIIQTSSPTTLDINFLTQRLNQETPEYGAAHPFGFFIRDEPGEIIAGCNGFLLYGTIYTDQLWVHPDHRRCGLGKELMENVHNYGRKEGCALATLATMEFQKARDFYEKLGYVCDFQRDGYINNSKCLYLKKKL